MCGIGGFSIVDPSNISDDAEKILSGISRRGPDGSATSVTLDNSYCFIHSRLAIIDLTENARQPMLSKNSDWLITFNGEIYNYPELKTLVSKRYPKYFWNSNSDTEVLLALIELMGVKEAISLISGMFAFAAYQISSKQLFLARDLFGEKPLYYSLDDNQVIFASDAQSLKNLRSDDIELNPDCVKKFLKYGFLPPADSIYKGVYQVEPGSFLTIQNGKISDVERYGSLEPRRRRFNPLGSEERHLSECESLIENAVYEACTSDVPIGFFLSGGIDSTVICSFANRLSSSPLDTYNIAFEEENYDESDKASRVAEILGTNHKSYEIKADDLMESITKTNQIWREPFADPSQLPMMILSQLVAKEKKVALSGDGGDELFCGYTRYTKGYDYFLGVKRFPPQLRFLVKNLMRSSILENLSLKLGNYERFLKFRRLFDCISDFEYFDKILTKSEVAPRAFLHTCDDNMMAHYLRAFENEDFRYTMMEVDKKVYLPSSVLTKVDRASMYFGLETRAPLLNRKLATYVSQLDMSLLYKNRVSKYILKKILERRQLDVIVNHPKQGFNVPLERWLRGPLRPWAEECFASQNEYLIKNFNQNAIRDLWREFLQGDGSKFADVWVMISFINWLRQR